MPDCRNIFIFGSSCDALGRAYSTMVDDFQSFLDTIDEALANITNEFQSFAGAMNDFFNIDLLSDMPIFNNEKIKRNSEKNYRIMMTNKQNVKFKNYHVYNISKNQPYQRRNF